MIALANHIAPWDEKIAARASPTPFRWWTKTIGKLALSRLEVHEITFVIVPFISSFSIISGDPGWKGVTLERTGIPLCSGIRAQRVTWKQTKTMTRPPRANSWKNLSERKTGAPW